MRTAVVLVLSGLALALPASAAARVTVWFEKGGEPVSVARRGSTIEGAVRALLAGPTAAERARGVRSAVPARTLLRELTVERRIVTVDLGSRFAAGRSDGSLRDRVGQLVRTVRAVPGVRAVRVLVEGGVPIGLFPGYDLRRPVSAAVEPTVRSPSARELRQFLVDLGFMATSGLSGADATQVATAVLGFQKWTG
ncbi:MAG: GerMN domain-containing protein, partial [Gaiellaceae bacterium]